MKLIRLEINYHIINYLSVNFIIYPVNDIKA